MIKQVTAGFTLNELLTYLRAERTSEAAGYRTAREWAEHFGIATAAMTKILREAKAQGVLSCQHGYRERLDGVMSPVPMYAFDLGETTTNLE